MTPPVSAAGAQRVVTVAETHLAIPPEIQGHDWPAGDVQRFADRYSTYRRHLEFRSEDVANRCDTYYLSRSMAMAVVDVASVEDFESPLVGQDILELHFRLSGSLEIGGPWGHCRILEPSYLLWLQPDGCRDAHERLSNGRQTWVSLYCDRSWIEQLRGGLPIDLQGASEDPACSEPQFKCGHQFGATIALLKDILRARRADPLHWLYMSNKAGDLLYTTLSSLAARPETNQGIRLSPRERTLLHEARDRLAAECVSTVSCTELARQVGMSQCRLATGFRQLFGESITEFIRHQRLNLAYQMLQNADLKIKQIAALAGYSHHATFTTAFTERFGFAPAALRGAKLRVRPRE